MPVHFPIINTGFVNPITRSTNSKISKTVLPVILTPIAAYYIGETRDNKAADVIQFF